MDLRPHNRSRRTPELRLVTALAFLLVGGLVPFQARAAAPGRWITARQLVRTVGSALEGAAQAASDPQGGLDRTQPGFAPFWNALANMRLRVSHIESALERRDGDLFLLIDQGSADLGALRVAWARTGAGNGTIAEGIRIASASYRLLRANYGREGFRFRQGGGLSDAERRQFQRVQRAERRFVASLQPLRERSRRLGDATTVAELDRFQSEAERIVWAPLDLEAYLNALIASGEMRGEWEADKPYVGKNAPEEAAAADAAVEDLYVESDIGQVFTVDLGSAGWSSLDLETEAPTEPQPAAGAVQVYQLAAGEAEAPAAGEIEAPVSESAEEEAGEGEPAEDMESESVDDPEGLEPTAVELVESDVLAEEDLPEGEAAAEDAPAAPAEGDSADKPAAQAGPAPAPAPVKGSKKAAEPVKPEPASPPAGDGPPLSGPSP